jgi:predicted dehydrogenase
MEKIKIGIIGFGNMGSGHAKHIHDGGSQKVEVTAICDIDLERIKVANELYPNVKNFDNAEDMIKSGLIEAVLIAIPHYFHPEMAKLAFENNLHVMCEKPAGVYTKQVLAMNEDAKKSGKVFGIMFQQRTNPLYQKLKNMIETNQFGHIKKVIWIVTDWYRPEIYHKSASWRSTWVGEGGGTIINQNPHNLDLWQWMFGMPNKLTSFCSWGKYYDIECDDDVTIYMEYDNGTIGIYTTSTAEAPGTNRLEISTDMGKVVIENDSFMFYRNVISEREHSRENKNAFAKPEFWECKVPVPTSDKQPHCQILDSFADAIREDKELLAKGVDGIYEMTISNAIYMSDWLGNVKIDLTNFDHEKFYELLMEKVGKSKTKTKKVEKVVSDTTGSY